MNMDMDKTNNVSLLKKQILSNIKAVHRSSKDHLTSPEEIKKWLATNCKGNGKVQVMTDGTVNINGNIRIVREITNFPVKFGVVTGDFSCDENNLTSLKGAPQKVGRDFSCDNNKFVSLKGAPKEVGGDFFCENNKLTSLQGAPQKVGGFFCDNNKLTSLQGAPKEVEGEFFCSRNNLTSLKGAPQKVGSGFRCYNNKLTSLQGAPKEVGGDFSCSGNKIHFTIQEVELVSKVRGEIRT